MAQQCLQWECRHFPIVQVQEWQCLVGRFSQITNFDNWIEGQAACNNEAFTLRLVDWLCKYDRTMTIAEARKDENHDGTPDKLGEKVTITGKVTSGTGKFFDVIYLQDETGGITVFGTVAF